MLLPLTGDIDSMWTGLDRKVRNQIRKAEKNALTTEVGGSELIEPFYDVFASRMRDLGTPVYSRAFFETIVATFPSTTRVFLVRSGATAVAAGISCEHRDILEVPWASSLKEYRDQCPNNLLYWHVIRYAIERGLRQLDFGRSTPGEGTFHFKQQWGAQQEPLCWEYRLLSRQTVPDQSPKNPKFRLAGSSAPRSFAGSPDQPAFRSSGA
jgi:FemAB-related protein (PEP-CTERM system-associated)